MSKQLTQLAGVRVLRGFPSRSSVATAAGLSEPTCWRIEASDQPVRPESIQSYAEAVGMEPSEVEMLRRPNGYVGARVVVLPLDAWDWLDEHGDASSAIAHLVREAS